MVDRAELTEAGRRVLDAAGTLFYRQGIAAVGVAEVAATAGVTKKTLYDCFGAKAALVAAYLADRDRRWWAEVEARLADGASPRTLVLFDAYLDHRDLDVEHGCAFLAAAAELSSEHPGHEVIVRHKAAVHARLAQLVRDDGATGGPELVDHVYLLLEGAAAHLRLGRRDLLRTARSLAASLVNRSV